MNSFMHKYFVQAHIHVCFHSFLWGQSECAIEMCLLYTCTLVNIIKNQSRYYNFSGVVNGLHSYELFCLYWFFLLP